MICGLDMVPLSLYWMSFGDVLADAESRCDHLKGLDKLACQKSAHKIKGLTGRPQQTADAVVNTRKPGAKAAIQ